MLQFTPFDPFNQYACYEDDSALLNTPSMVRSNTDFTEQPENSLTTQQRPRNRQSSTSQQHNMIKHIFTTIKMMMGQHIAGIGNHYTQPIIKEVWKIFQKSKCPNRKTLKAMFDKSSSQKFIEANGFKQILLKYGITDYQLAMQQLREEVVLRMGSQSLKRHLMDRDILRKDRVAAYGQYLVQEEIKKGEILLRTNEHSKRRIQQIMDMNRGEREYIDQYLSLGDRSY